MEPMVDFQLGAANIRMCFTVRGNGVSIDRSVHRPPLLGSLPCLLLALSTRPILCRPNQSTPPPPSPHLIVIAPHQTRRHLRAVCGREALRGPDAGAPLSGTPPLFPFTAPPIPPTHKPQILPDPLNQSTQHQSTRP